MDAGAAYLFDTATGQQIAKLLPKDGAPGDRFGRCAILDNLAIITSPFDDDNGADSGSAYLFDITTGQQIAKLLPNDGAAGDNFGGSVSISGGIAVIVALNNDDNGDGSGAAYLFDITTGQQIAKILPDDGEPGDNFGRDVGISDTTVIAAAPYDDDNGNYSGSAYLFDVGCGGPICADSGTVIEGFGLQNDFNAACGSDDVRWAAHGATFAFQIGDPVTQFELSATAPTANPGSISFEVEASKQNTNGNLNVRALMFNFDTGQYVALPGVMGLTTSDALRTFVLPVGADPLDYIDSGSNEVRLLLQTIQASGLSNVRTQLDQVLLNIN